MSVKVKMSQLFECFNNPISMSVQERERNKEVRNPSQTI